MVAISQALKTLVRGAFLLLAFVLLQSVACPDIEYKGSLKRDKVDKFPTYEEVFCRLVKDLGKGKKIAFTSLYRSEDDQLAACKKACPDKRCCPGTCACPGRSNHQHHATADVGNIPGDVKAGCDFLLKVCNEIKACGKNVGCEIGGYGAGTHHLSADEGVKNTAYNQCAYLKSQVASGGGGECKNKDGKKEPPKQQQPSEPPPPNPNPAQQMQQANELMKKVMNPEQAQYPQAKPYADKFPGATSPTPDSTNSSRDKTAGNAGKVGGSVPNPISDITRGNAGGLENAGFGSGGFERGTTHGSANGPFVGSSGQGGSGNYGGSGADFSGGPMAISVTKSEKKETNEVLATFGGGNKYLGSSKNPDAMGGLETDAAVKNTVNEFEQMLGRDPASNGEGNARGDSVGGAEGESLFSRCHEAHMRSLRGGKLSR